MEFGKLVKVSRKKGFQMKVTYEFDYDNPEDYHLLKKVFEPAQNISFALWDTIDLFRDILKYNGIQFTEEQLVAVEALQEEFFNILKQHHVQEIIEES